MKIELMALPKNMAEGLKKWNDIKIILIITTKVVKINA